MNVFERLILVCFVRSLKNTNYKAKKIKLWRNVLKARKLLQRSELQEKVGAFFLCLVMSIDKMTATRSKNVVQAPPQDENMYTSDWMLYPPDSRRKKVLIYIPFHLQSQLAIKQRASSPWSISFWVLTLEFFWVITIQAKCCWMVFLYILIWWGVSSWTYFGPLTSLVDRS